MARSVVDQPALSSVPVAFSGRAEGTCRQTRGHSLRKPTLSQGLAILEAWRSL